MDELLAKKLAGDLRGRSVGGWEVGEYLGSGASGVVVAATKNQTHAALKIIDPYLVDREGTDKQYVRVMRENSLRGHTHPHLVQIFEGGKCTATGCLYVVMERLEPRTLADVLNELPAAYIGPLIAQLAAAARFLEERGIVHRDIKPKNTHISSDLTTIKLLDLGVIYPRQDTDGPSAGTRDQFLGTARYSPPEFLYRKEEDSIEGWRAITFYQLGATLYDLLMRQPIFDNFREPPARLYEAITNHTPIVNPPEAVDAWLVDLARRCLVKDWQHRNQLVCWPDFEGPRTPLVSANDIRTRLMNRIGRDSSLTKMSRQSQTATPSRQLLNSLSHTVSTAVRQICQRGAVFPPTEIRQSTTSNRCSVTVLAGPSAVHQLDGVLEIRLSLVPLGLGTESARITVSARVCPASADRDDPPEDTFGTLYTGPLRDPYFQRLLDIYLHAVLESALLAGTPDAYPLVLQPNYTEC